MTVLATRNSLHEYIRFADEKKIKALYTIVEDEINENHDVWTNEFLQEMQKRSGELATGKAKGGDWLNIKEKAKKILNKTGK